MTSTPRRMLMGAMLLVACTSGLPRGESSREVEKRAAARDVDSITGSSSFNSVSSKSSGTFRVPLQLGCAAALLCVEETYCTADGTISTEPVALTSKQILRRVPLSSCKNPETGLVGKCCRDPNYVDPWPTGNLPANYSGGFDEQGFPTFLNIARVEQPKKPVPTTNAVRVTTAIPTIAPIPTTVFAVPESPAVHVPSETSNVPDQTIEEIPEPNGVIPLEQEVAPFPPQVAFFPDTPDASSPEGSLSNQIPNVLGNFPNFPVAASSPRPFSKSNDGVAPSDQYPATIATLPPDHCGIKNNVPRPAGLNDFETAFGEIPWQAMILSNPRRQILCSGAIVAPNVVLTAASCVYRLQPSDVSVKTGEWKLGYELEYEEPLPFEIINVATILPHPYYAEGSASNDTAILLLEHPMSYDVHVNTLCIPEESRIHETRQCIVTGWGKTILQVNVAGSIMHGIDVDVLPRDVCEERLSVAESHMDIDDNVICAKSHNRHTNMCQVDIGSPLACKTESGAYELVGIYSQDTGCLPTNQVAAFAHIDTAWLKAHYLSVSSTENKAIIDVPSPISTDEYDPIPDSQQETEEYRKSNLPPNFNQYLPPL